MNAIEKLNGRVKASLRLVLLGGMTAGLLGLAGCGGGAGGGGTASSTPGARVYLQNCMGCHGPNGRGMGMQPPLPGSPTLNGDVAALTGWVMFGVRPATTPAGKYASMMPQFHYLKDQELADVLSHTRSQWGNQAPAVTVADIQASRQAHAPQ